MPMDLNRNPEDDNFKGNSSKEKKRSNPLSYETARDNLKLLNGTWGTFRNKAENFRLSRYLDVDNQLAKDSGMLDADELFSPVKLIDRNIRREQSKYINYLVASRRIAIFSANDDPGLDTSLLEKDFSKRAKYPGWQLPYYS